MEVRRETSERERALMAAQERLASELDVARTEVQSLRAAWGGRALVATPVEGTGYRVHPATNPMEAVAVQQQLPPPSQPQQQLQHVKRRPATMPAPVMLTPQELTPPPACTPATMGTPGEPRTPEAMQEVEELRALKSELLASREMQRAHGERLLAREREQEQLARQQAQESEQLRQQVVQTQAWQLGLRDAGGQLVARMTQLRQDVAERCQQVEKSARDDVRRRSVGPVTGAGGAGL